ncbi:MAG TPA: hypothetical protein VGJ13_11685 [Pseudonocardiaceae bacterium]
MLSPNELRRCLAGCRDWCRASGTSSGERLCTAALDGTNSEVTTRVAPPGRILDDDWTNLLRAEPEQVLAAVLHGTAFSAERLALALDARLVNSVHGNDLPTGATVLQAALVAGLGHRPTIARGVDLLLLATCLDGGFAGSWHGATTGDPLTTVRCAWALAEAYRPGFTRDTTALNTRVELNTSVIDATWNMGRKQ